MDGAVNLGVQAEEAVSELLASGLYESRDAVLRAGIELVRTQARLAALDAAIARGIDDADAGRVHDSDEVKAYIRECLKSVAP